MPAAIQTALEHLRRSVEQARSAGKAELPSARSMAGCARVSSPVMLAAMHALVREGVLRVSHGRRSVVTGVAQAAGPRDEPEGSYAWERLARQMRYDILVGRYEPDSPLAAKETAHRLGVNYRTLAKALAVLSRDGLLRRHGRTHQVVGTRAGSPGDTVVLIGRGDSARRLSLMPPNGELLLHTIDRLCSRAGASVTTAPYYYAGPSRLVSSYDWSNRRNAIAARHSILGFVVVLTALDIDVPGLLRALARFGVPTAVIDESPWPRASAAAGRSPVAWVSAINSREAGEKVGTHLLALGHRRVAYICPFADRDWSPPRLDGLRCVYAAAGLADAVSAYVDSTPELVPVARRAADVVVREALLPALKQLALPDDTPWPSPRARDAFWERASQQLSGAAGWAASETLPATRALLPLAFRALRDGGHTAWVASNTTAGLLLLDLLESVGTRVPQDLSLASFDDTFTATSRRLTAYDFDIEATANAAVNHVLNPGRSHAGLRVIRVSGRVNARATTAAPAGEPSQPLPQRPRNTSARS